MPLVIAFVVAAGLGLVIIYTFHQRVSQTAPQQGEQPAQATPKTGAPAVLADHQGVGFIEEEHRPARALSQPSSSSSASSTTRTLSAADQANIDAWQDYDRRKRALEQARLESEVNAYGAAPDVRLQGAKPAAISGLESAQGAVMEAEAGAEAAKQQRTTVATQIQGAAQQAPSLDTVPVAQSFGGLGGGLLGGGLLGGGAGIPPANPNANDQSGKRNFLAQPGAAANEDYLAARVTTPMSPYELKAGSVIPATMLAGINSDLPGEVIGQVRENVYDTATGEHVLIPQGSRLVGVYHSGVSYGQTRVLVAWNRVIYPNGNSFDLGTMPGADEGAYAGFSDQVNNHYLRIFSSALLASVFSAGVQLSQPQDTTNGVTPSQVLTAAVGQQANNVGQQLIARGLDIQPTLEIRNGYLFTVMVTKDLVLTPWEGMQPLSYGTPGR
jgi:type IV secretion system protein VirB10